MTVATYPLGGVLALATLFWPDYSQVNARAALRNVLNAIRVVLGKIGTIMVLVWKGAGRYTVSCYFVTLLIVNYDLFTHFSAARYIEINWWVPALVTGIFNVWLINYVTRMSGKADPQTFAGRRLLYLGTQHHIFWIPLTYWTIIFLVLNFIGLGLNLFH